MVDGVVDLFHSEQRKRQESQPSIDETSMGLMATALRRKSDEENTVDSEELTTTRRFYANSFLSLVSCCAYLNQTQLLPERALYRLSSAVIEGLKLLAFWSFYDLGKMIKLFKVKEKQREIAENANANGKSPIKKQSAGELRLHKDISELNLPKTCGIVFPNGKDDLMNFEVTIRPDEGYYLKTSISGLRTYKNFIFWEHNYFKCAVGFDNQVSPIYPHEAPKVKCKTKVYHPNIDLEGNVCLNILREDWKPVLNINTIIYGLFHLFTQPNCEDPLNHEAAAVLRDNPKLFESNVRRAMAGGYVGQTFFTRCM
ncbi:hypothetical protein Pint_34580 [Pistacia integerrima]|uniref:Uncharacterized protein n=1 Tax=Pistacia integerrima TaxID=434235 RepID=A0ACC0X6R4_9ROSI|nr:hypothetical protein Pint_34580 [Pistacia integerrima]